MSDWKASKPLSPESRSLREAARHIGLDLYTTNRFVAAAVAWLVQRGSVTITLAGDDGYAIQVSGGMNRAFCADERFDWALAGAIHGVAGWPEGVT